MKHNFLNVGKSEDERAIDLLYMLRAAENEQKYRIAQILRILIGKYNQEELDIKEAQGQALLMYGRETAQQEWIKKELTHVHEMQATARAHYHRSEMDR